MNPKDVSIILENSIGIVEKTVGRLDRLFSHRSNWQEQYETEKKADCDTSLLENSPIWYAKHSRINRLLLSENVISRTSNHKGLKIIKHPSLLYQIWQEYFKSDCPKAFDFFRNYLTKDEKQFTEKKIRQLGKNIDGYSKNHDASQLFEKIDLIL